MYVLPHPPSPPPKKGLFPLSRRKNLTHTTIGALHLYLPGYQMALHASYMSESSLLQRLVICPRHHAAAKRELTRYTCNSDLKCESLAIETPVSGDYDLIDSTELVLSVSCKLA